MKRYYYYQVFLMKWVMKSLKCQHYCYSYQGFLVAFELIWHNLTKSEIAIKKRILFHIYSFFKLTESASIAECTSPIRPSSPFRCTLDITTMASTLKCWSFLLFSKLLIICCCWCTHMIQVELTPLFLCLILLLLPLLFTAFDDAGEDPIRQVLD